ncbi:hypothetical protein VTK56DRAFT_7186 [Thermocarpiscus australiensis]
MPSVLLHYEATGGVRPLSDRLRLVNARAVPSCPGFGRQRGSGAVHASDCCRGPGLMDSKGKRTLYRTYGQVTNGAGLLITHALKLSPYPANRKRQLSKHNGLATLRQHLCLIPSPYLTGPNEYACIMISNFG